VSKFYGTAEPGLTATKTLLSELNIETADCLRHGHRSGIKRHWSEIYHNISAI
jgi:hypothetical protein